MRKLLVKIAKGILRRFDENPESSSPEPASEVSNTQIANSQAGVVGDGNNFSISR